MLIAALFIIARKWLKFIITKEYKVKLAKEKDGWGKVQRKPGTSFQWSSPNGVTHG